MRSPPSTAAASSDWATFDDWIPVPTEFTEVGDRVVVRVRQSARGKASGVPIAEDVWFVFELRGARIAKMSICAHEAEALEATGMSR